MKTVIGIRLANDGRVHVLWVNKKDGELSRQTTDQSGFNYARSPETLGTHSVRHSATYAETFTSYSIASVVVRSLWANQETQQNPVKHPLNQILYGPPGTGKTYHTVNRALAIIDGERVRGTRLSVI